MALVIVISTGDFQIRCNVLSLSFTKRESGKWPLELSDFLLFDCIIILSIIDCIQHSGEISICNASLWSEDSSKNRSLKSDTFLYVVGTIIANVQVFTCK